MFLVKNKKVWGVILEGFRSPRGSGCVGGGRISILNVSEDCFCDFFCSRFSVRFGGAVFDDFGAVGRSVGQSGARSVGQALGRSVPPPPSPQKKCGVILHLVCGSLV